MPEEIFMLLRWYASYAIILFTAGLVPTAQALSKRVATYSLEKRVNNITFTYRIEVTDGEMSESWTVNGEEVSPERYEELLVTAKIEAQRDKHEKEREQFLARERLHQKLQFVKAKEKLSDLLQVLEKICNSLTKYNLEPYYVFSSKTIVSLNELHKIRYDILPEVRKLLEQSPTEVSIATLQEKEQLLTGYPDRLTNFFYATLDNAITKCSDTKLLKKLLALLP